VHDSVVSVKFSAPFLEFIWLLFIFMPVTEVVLHFFLYKMHIYLTT